MPSNIIIFSLMIFRRQFKITPIPNKKQSPKKFNFIKIPLFFYVQFIFYISFIFLQICIDNNFKRKNNYSLPPSKRQNRSMILFYINLKIHFVKRIISNTCAYVNECHTNVLIFVYNLIFTPIFRKKSCHFSYNMV